MATIPWNTVSERVGPSLVTPRRRAKLRKSSSVKGRLVSTAVTLMVLALVLRFLPARTRNAQAHEAAAAVQTAPVDLHFSDVQLSMAPDGEALYLDGLVTNVGKGNVSGATAEVEFRDAQGRVVGRLQEPLVGMAHGGTDLVQNEFVRNPITPKEIRFFRIAVERVPAAWNHEVPALKVVAVETP